MFECLIPVGVAEKTNAVVGISSVVRLVVSCAAVVEIAKIHRELKKKIGKKIVD